MITTLNPKFCFAMIIIALAGLENEVSSSHAGIAAFILGAAATLPLIIQIWRTMKNNWPVYRKFYSMPFHRRDMNVVRKSWRMTWWVVPYALVVYSILDLFLLLNPSFGTPYSMLYGALFVNFGYTLLQGSRYYDDVRKKN